MLDSSVMIGLIRVHLAAALLRLAHYGIRTAARHRLPVLLAMSDRCIRLTRRLVPD